MQGMWRFLLAALGLLAAGSAAAQPAPARDPAAAALAQARAFIAASPCRTATASPAAPPAQFNDATVREASYHRILIEGCGRRMQRNYLHLVMPDGSQRLVETLPGTTVTDPVLQRDAMRSAAMAAHAGVPTCQQLQPRAAEFEGQDSEPRAARRTRPWSEAWIFEGCGAFYAVPMRFTPTDRGTSFSAGSGVRRLN